MSDPHSLNPNLDRRGLAYLALAARGLSIQVHDLRRKVLARTAVYGAAATFAVVDEIWLGWLGPFGYLLLTLSLVQLSGWWSCLAQASDDAAWLDDLAGRPTITHHPTEEDR